MNNEYEARRAPYAPISALREFFEKMRDMTAPTRIDRRFLQKMNVASSNEWALLSALKFLGIVDEHGAPTHAYRLLQTTDRFRETLAHLVLQAYKDLFDSGGAEMEMEDLRNYFRVTSSPSQAKNAARFFREVCGLAGIGKEATDREAKGMRGSLVSVENVQHSLDKEERPSSITRGRSAVDDDLLAAKARLLEKLPPPRADWSAAEYQAICDRFLSMLHHLDPTH